MAAYQSELSVITKAKDLCSYIMTVTDESPKRFRFTLVAKLQSYALNTYRSKGIWELRLDESPEKRTKGYYGRKSRDRIKSMM